MQADALSGSESPNVRILGILQISNRNQIHMSVCSQAPILLLIPPVYINKYWGNASVSITMCYGGYVAGILWDLYQILMIIGFLAKFIRRQGRIDREYDENIVYQNKYRCFFLSRKVKEVLNDLLRSTYNNTSLLLPHCWAKASSQTKKA